MTISRARVRASAAIVTSRKSQRTDDIAAEISRYLQRLTGLQFYADSLARWGRTAHLAITVWEVGRASSNLEHGSLKTLLTTFPIPFHWHRFLQGPGSIEDQTNGTANIFLTTHMGFLPVDPQQLGLTAREMEDFTTRFQSGWPDIIVLDHLFTRSGIAGDKVASTLNSYFHFLEPGGILIIAEESSPQISEFVIENGGVQGNDGIVDKTWSLFKEPNIYTRTKAKIADRNKIFQQNTCREAVIRTLDLTCPPFLVQS